MVTNGTHGFTSVNVDAGFKADTLLTKKKLSAQISNFIVFIL